jgi:WD repeat-containing protein 23
MTATTKKEVVGDSFSGMQTQHCYVSYGARLRCSLLMILLVSRSQVMRLLATVDLGNGRLLDSWRSWNLARTAAEQNQEEAETATREWRQNRSKQSAVEKVPDETGRGLMNESTFGRAERRQGRIHRTKRQARRILEREMGSSSWGREKSVMPLLKQDMIPEDTPDMVIQYNSRCYSGQFSTDGNFFYSCNQDLRVRMYDTSNPYDWKYYKQVVMPYGQWTITDAALTADNKWLAYSSMSHIICLAPTDPLSNAEPRPLDLSKTVSGRSARIGSSSRWFSSYSVRFSGDGRELVVGTGDNAVYVFDIERDCTVLRIASHDDDVNAVCFGDPNSPHILYSGSDDCTVKVWDRRSMGDGRAAGVFVGHTEGVTYVDSAGDGRYVISNGKDQTAKLWDLRQVMSPDRANKINTYKYSQGWDYRGGGYDIRQWRAHPWDCSLVTFRGHAVEKTLIRCHFSPQGSTDKRYIYSGSADGKVYIWNMDATLKGTIDVGESTEYLRERDSQDLDYHWGSRGGAFGTVIRDVSWHPDVPMVAGIFNPLSSYRIKNKLTVAQQRHGMAGAPEWAPAPSTAGTTASKPTTTLQTRAAVLTRNCALKTKW